jgi:uncharacterized membrane protein (UPF0127 family)
MSEAAASGAIRRDGEILFTSVSRPRSFWQRARGLIGRPPLASHEAWWFERCNSIHMFGMRYPIDVVFLDSGKRVLKLSERLPPFGLSACPRADSVLEIAAGAAHRKGLRVGQQLEITP